MYYLRLDFAAETVFFKFESEFFRLEAATAYKEGEDPPGISYEEPPKELQDQWELTVPNKGIRVWTIKYPNIYPQKPN
jgi:hypothetical protein